VSIFLPCHYSVVSALCLDKHLVFMKKKVFRHVIHSYGRVKMTREGRIYKKKLYILQPHKSLNPLNFLCVCVCAPNSGVTKFTKSCTTQMNTQLKK